MRLLIDLMAAANAVVLSGVLVCLLIGPARKFWVVVIYVGWQLASTVGLTAADVLYRAPEQRVLYAHLYWTNEVALDLLLFLVVMVLTYQATPEGMNRRKIARFLSIVAVVIVALPFLVLHPSFTPWPSTEWFNSTGEILNFGAAVMNLALWGALIAYRRRDPQLLKVSAGLGVVVTGTAISYGLRHFIPVTGFLRPFPNFLAMLSQPAGWAVWCWAFWPVRKRAQAPEHALPSP